MQEGIIKVPSRLSESSEEEIGDALLMMSDREKVVASDGGGEKLDGSIVLAESGANESHVEHNLPPAHVTEREREREKDRKLHAELAVGKRREETRSPKSQERKEEENGPLSYRL
jgi:hypothetical protein